MPTWGNRRPPFGTPIDRSHPLAQKLLAAYTFHAGVGANVFNSASPLGPTLPFSLAPTWSAAGLVTNTAGAGAQATTPAFLKINPPLTMYWRGQALAAPVANVRLFDVHVNATNTAPFVGYAVGYNSTGDLVFAWNDGTIRTLISSAADPTAGQVYSLAGTLQKSTVTGDAGIFYQDRKVVASTALNIPTTITYTAGSVTIVGQPSWFNTVNSNHVHHAAYIWSRVLSPEEIAWLDLEPYALFQYPTGAGIAWSATLGPMSATIVPSALAGAGSLLAAAVTSTATSAASRLTGLGTLPAVVVTVSVAPATGTLAGAGTLPAVAVTTTARVPVHCLGAYEEGVLPAVVVTGTGLIPPTPFLGEAQVLAPEVFVSAVVDVECLGDDLIMGLLPAVVAFSTASTATPAFSATGTLTNPAVLADNRLIVNPAVLAGSGTIGASGHAFDTVVTVSPITGAGSLSGNVTAGLRPRPDPSVSTIAATRIDVNLSTIQILTEEVFT